MHQASRLRRVVTLLDIHPVKIGSLIVSEGTGYLHPLRRLVCCLRLLPTVGQWSERIQGVATPSGVESIVVRGPSLNTGGLYTFL